jgi:hypothetical protein
MRTPRCSNCEASEAQCLIYNAAKQAEVDALAKTRGTLLNELQVPRDYVTILEAQVARLSRENDGLRARTPTDVSPPNINQARNEITVTPCSTSPDWVATSLGRIVSEPSSQSPFYGMSSGITLARLVMAAVHVEDSTAGSTDPPNRQISGFSSSQPTNKATLPPRHAAQHLIDVYFQFQTPHAPVIERVQVEEAVANAYQYHGQPGSIDDRESSHSLFIVYMVFAVALCSIDHPSGDRPPQSLECFNSAMSYLETVFVYSRDQLEVLRALLLLCQYVALCPAKGSLWLLTGTALRLAIDLGLHWEPERTDMNFRQLNDRRCLWWSAYQFDRMLCITIGRPFGIQEPGINVALPELRPFHTSQEPHPFTVNARKAHNSLICMTRLESEIKHVLYGHLLLASPAYPKPDHCVWLPDIQSRLDSWRATLPPPSDADPASIFAHQEFWDAIYHNALLFLHRPNSLAPHPTADILRSYFNAACKVIASIKTLHRRRKIDIVWKWTHQLFMAGLALLYCVWGSQGLREDMDLKICIPSLQACASTLSAISERWSGAVGCRDVFEALSSITTDWLITNSAERASRMRFEEQLQALQDRIPPIVPGFDATGDALTMLSTDGYGFGEYLNSFAQWPQAEFADLWTEE